VSVIGPGTPFVGTNVEAGCCPRLGWTVDGMPVPDVNP
jgi:hypothetical protein